MANTGNPFPLSDERLKDLLNSYSEWISKHPEEMDYHKKQADASDDIRKKLLDKEFLDSSTDEALSAEIHRYSRTLEGPAYIRLGEPRIKGEISNLRRNLQYLIQDTGDPFEKADRILDGDYKIPVFAKAFWSPILQARYPETLPNWNKKTEDFLAKLEINTKSKIKSTNEKYQVISNAFKYLKLLDPDQDFYTLNHLMHYGTAVEEGVAIMSGLMGNDVEVLRKAHVTEQRISVRLEAEKKAGELLRVKSGRFSAEDLRQFFAWMNKDFSKGKERKNRFNMAYVGSNLNALVDQLSIVNEWISKFYNAEGAELESFIEEYFNKMPIKHAGVAFPSVILYVRDPDKYNLCFRKMVDGFKQLTGFSNTAFNSAFYFKYNDKANAFRKKHNLRPQELDILLCAVSGVDPPPPNGGYSLDQCCSGNGFARKKALIRWVRAIHRKGTRPFCMAPQVLGRPLL